MGAVYSAPARCCFRSMVDRIRGGVVAFFDTRLATELAGLRNG
jgi:hypothetical protein